VILRRPTLSFPAEAGNPLGTMGSSAVAEDDNLFLN
jgi:hypothetical protein